MQESVAELVRRNEVAFRQRQPQIWAFLERLPRLTKLVTDDAGKPTNILVEDKPLYPAPAAEWTTAQLEAYFTEPDRLSLDNVGYCNVSQVSEELRLKLGSYMTENKLVLPRQPVRDIGFAFVFGIGLGYHIQPLLQRTDCRRLVIFEPVPEFLLHSLAVVDWMALFDRMEAGDLQITLTLRTDPTDAVFQVEKFISQVRPTFLDGSYAYMHYFSWPLRQARAILNEKIKAHYITSGFFEDEILMTRNTYLNLHQWDFRAVNARPMRQQTTPVFVVGSGPSLDDSLPHIRRWRDRAIVVSCGSALGILLKHGIRPEFHVENENSQPLVNNLRDFHKDYGLQGIRLLASTTVPADVGGLFDERFYYFRSHLSSAYLLSAGVEPVAWAAPMVANAAVAAMAALGFQHFTLFGVDCGRPHNASHHAADAIYHREDYDNYAPGESYEMLETGFDREVPGNFGGTVLTTWYLDLSRTAFAGLINSRPITVVNCGRGARIDGAQPKAVHALKLEEAPPNRQAAVIADVTAQCPAYAAGDFLKRTDLVGLAEGAENFAAAWTELMAEIAAGAPSFWALERRVNRFSQEALDDHKAVFALAHASISSMIRIGAFGGTRMADDEMLRRYFDVYLELYDKAVRDMADRTATMMREIAMGRNALSEPDTSIPAS